MFHSDIVAKTPKVLDRCLDLYLAPDGEKTGPTLTAKSTPAKYASHPDFQFFSSVKKKHHFAYHSSKFASVKNDISATSTLQKQSTFDPFSRPLLLERIRSYTALNWALPHFPRSDRQLTELLCSAHGWVCEQVSRKNTSKNLLRCTGCDRQLALTFNPPDQQPEYAACYFDIGDIQELNVKLKDQYLRQVEHTAHAGLCPWRNIASPLDGTYYLTPYIEATNDTLITEYLALLRRTYHKIDPSSHYAHVLLELAPQDVMLNLAGFIKVSRLWLLSRYFKDSKENFEPVLERNLPSWAYVLAAMGWEINVQTFGDVSIPLLVCTMCNQKIFLDAESAKSGTTDTKEKRDLHDLQKENVPLQSIFQKPPEPRDSGPESNADCSEDVLGEAAENNLACHKPWCLLVHSFDNKPYFSYFHEMIVELKSNIGPEGQYQEKCIDFATGPYPADMAKKRKADVTENLERFSKLRKLYFADADL
ncbi:hypothetical protein METBIDRAFT_206976 [Metschnikowia bicuspidata var. bicuspidata NRRL YB-4993]|uniref:C3HC-type domain-containing protein n=1 Tax=Metschnikowia bicuspidata var. bicuspidata NRRL YB-4993 TaxID=869754 RepID=A0A1A0H711_9ASCO|nr:hypothetical protein METBIDRAFT_206976 [Metschnikowia bicuspidata var. bicuspidata NRRL YB-4993]OBA19745.1 hypothetical protein METBIDRAFT_206976 [Metschnikowia bicuspidata var. bicuspidata NRRL YB-4993]